MPEAAYKKTMLRKLPKVDQLLSEAKLQKYSNLVDPKIITKAIRLALDSIRENILSRQVDDNLNIKDIAIEKSIFYLDNLLSDSQRRVINATGVVLHTNLGRSLLSQAAIDAYVHSASGYTNLELSLDTGKRGSRHNHLSAFFAEVSGAEDGIAVNNNAAAVLMILNEFANEKEVIVSRGELVEIGGSFRVPDIMKASGSKLIEVGTTNKTKKADYEKAITDKTAMVLKIHLSNFEIVGFSESASLEDLQEVAKSANLAKTSNYPEDAKRANPSANPDKILVYEDLGCGALIELDNFGKDKHVTVQASEKAGIDLISFSGDKLMGGPQADIIVGKKEYIKRLKSNPLMRVLRLDKHTIAALRATLVSYLSEQKAICEIPTLSMIAEDCLSVKT